MFDGRFGVACVDEGSKPAIEIPLIDFTEEGTIAFIDDLSQASGPPGLENRIREEVEISVAEHVFPHIRT